MLLTPVPRPPFLSFLRVQFALINQQALILRDGRCKRFPEGLHPHHLCDLTRRHLEVLMTTRIRITLRPPRLQLFSLLVLSAHRLLANVLPNLAEPHRDLSAHYQHSVIVRHHGPTSARECLKNSSPGSRCPLDFRLIGSVTRNSFDSVKSFSLVRRFHLGEFYLTACCQRCFDPCATTSNRLYEVN